MKSLSVGTVYDLSIQILIQLKSISNIKKLRRSNYWLPAIPLRPSYRYGPSTLAVSLMAKYGLNSASAAAMVIARRALGFPERIPRQYLVLLGRPEDRQAQELGSVGSRM